MVTANSSDTEFLETKETVLVRPPNEQPSHEGQSLKPSTPKPTNTVELSSELVLDSQHTDSSPGETGEVTNRDLSIFNNSNGFPSLYPTKGFTQYFSDNLRWPPEPTLDERVKICPL